MDEVTAAQAAAMTGFSERTIRRKIAAGELPARRVAPNRFAIDVLDLPQRWNDRDLVRRIDALEHRVRLLEEGQRTLMRQIGARPGEQHPGTSTDMDTSGSATEGEAAVAELHDMLAQLTEQTERLGPLFAVQEPAEERPSTGDRKGSGPLRSARGGEAGQHGA